jgi:antitoxin MazE
LEGELASTQLAKWGNSLALRIPKELAESAKLREGDPVTLSVAQEGRVVVSAARRKYRLKHLVSRITAKNRHDETDWGIPVGREMR